MFDAVWIPSGRFREFRFNDHLVWGAIFTLGMVLVPLPSPVAVIAVGDPSTNELKNPLATLSALADALGSAYERLPH